MKLQRLELYGFKSFADRVAIEFNPGMTAIVGPNGCGKSNISDAIRWVLGEQRPTLVRGARMEEVIFGGSRERKPINLAEVTLHFSNEDGLLPIGYSEVAIGRRVHRDGESEYLLNRNPCRLKDIQDLFFGTGVGAHAYSLIQQGMVDGILSDRTEDRRTIFEEAAGVTRYKIRRRAAERKLEATTQDLLRVEDIVAEVERTVGSLKRQVGRARRFREYHAEETRLEVHAAAREVAALDERRTPLGAEIRALEAAEVEEAARLGEREAALEALELELLQAREAESAARAAADELKRRIARREESRIVTAETLRHHGERLDALAADRERAGIRADDLAERRANLEVDLRAALGRLEAVAARMGPDAGSAAEETRIAELKAERARLTERVEGLRERLSEVRQAGARQATAEEAAEERATALAAELEGRRMEAASARAGAEEARRSLSILEERKAAEATELSALRARAEEAVRRRDLARERLAAERAAEQAAAGLAEGLSALEARYEGYADGAQALLAGGDRVAGLEGVLPRAIEPAESRFETALERYLESLGNALLARDRQAAFRGAERLAVDGGRADFLVSELVANGPVPSLPDDAAAVVLARGSEAMRWTADPELGRRFEPLFARLLLVADAPAAFRCRSALAEDPQAARHYVIAGLDGTLLEPTGRWRTAGRRSDGGLLARRRRLAEAEGERERRRAAAAALLEELERSERELGDAESTLAAAEAAAAGEAGERLAARAALGASEEAHARTLRHAAEIEERLARATEARERARASVAAVLETEAELAADIARLEEGVASTAAALDRLEQGRAERVTARHAVELERGEAEAGLRAVERELEHLAAAEEALGAGRSERAAERARIEEDVARLEGERAAIAEEIEGLFGELEGVEARVRECGELLRSIEERRAAYDAEIRALRRRHEETIEGRHRSELALQDLDLRRESLLAHLSETYGAGPAELVERHPLADGEADLAVEELKARLEEVRRRLANLGPVNMLAVEEHDREAERLQFLTIQRDDLVQAKRQLEEAIRRINATARELFVDTFDKVRASFDESFRTLFEGGHAEVRLAADDDPLESPIEIVASPRGKRVQSIGLLSGGERALTALALLFAIYRVKPSPFCILDEVDAPLDDANVGRFLAMIRHFSADTQFIVITHNRRTMEAADYLYGVTMEEPGVSTLVSVSLQESRAEESLTDDAPRYERALAATG